MLMFLVPCLQKMNSAGRAYVTDHKNSCDTSVRKKRMKLKKRIHE